MYKQALTRLGAVTILLNSCLLIQLLTATAPEGCCRAQTSLHREYTKESPLIYEDAWDLWPYVFLDDNGQPAGYNIDLLKLIFERLEIPYVIRLKPMTQALKDLQEHKSDLMLGMVANFHDNYTAHYGKNTIQLFTHSVAYPKKNATRVHHIKDLATQKVIVHDSSFSHHLMEDRGWGGNAIPYGDMEKAVQEVSAEESGQVLWNTMSLKWIIHKYNTFNLELDPVEMPSGDYRFMANDPLLLEMLDNTLSQLKAEDLLTPIEEKWFYPEKATQAEGTPRWVFYALILVVLASLTLIVSSLVYKIQESKKTREGQIRNARLTMILKTCNVRIFTYNVNRKNFTWYGRGSVSKKVFSTTDFAQNYRPDDFKKLMEAISRIASGEAESTQMEMSAVDNQVGTERAYMIRLSTLRREKDLVTTIIGTMSDVTDEKKRQTDAELLMKRYGSVFNTAMIDMVFYDRDGYIVDMNERSQINLNLPLKKALEERVNIRQFMGGKVFDFDEFASNGLFYATVFVDKSSGLAVPYTKDRESVYFYELKLVAVFDSDHELIGIFGTGRNVTEVAMTYNKAQENVWQLQKAMQDEADHVDNINYALQVGGIRMVSYSPDTHILTINHRMHEAQYVLTQQRCLQLAGEASQRKLMYLFRTMDKRRLTSLDCDIRTKLRLPNGRQLCMQMHIFPTTDKTGQVTTYTGILRDTSEIIHTEMMLQQNTEKAQEVELVKSQFLHNMCHEIMTPLNIVVRFAEMFETSKSEQEEKLFTRQIKESSAYLLKLINDILFLSRLDAGMMESNVQPCDFSKTFEGHCTMGMSLKIREGVRFVVENHYKKLDLLIDDANIGRIIQQVVENALEHTTEGSVKARYEYIGGKLVVDISDTGTGISQEKMKHLFERFSSTGSNTQGTGLGLPICKELAAMLGGTIDVNSEEGIGTRVWITIPCKALSIVHKKEA
jgi:signal transduction histidine kinase/ABC-type amino acid transport substrate-binding protein